MRQDPLVTIITPSFNHAQYLRNTVKSVLDQTYKNIEYIIVDDGSKDNSHEVLREIQKEYPFIRLMLHKDNKGHVRINEAVAASQGQFISILSSDDWYLPEKIEKQVALFQSLPEDYGVVYSAGYRYYEKSGVTREAETNDKMKRGFILKDLLTDVFFIYPITPLIKRECLLRYPFSSQYRAEGEGIYFKIAMKYKFDFVDEPLVVMRDHEYNTGKDTLGLVKDVEGMLKSVFAHPDFPSDMKYLEAKALSKLYLLNGWELIRLKKDYKAGRSMLLSTVKKYPQSLFHRFALPGIILSVLPPVLQKIMNR